MTLGRCSCAPKWLIKARNNRLPVSEKTRQKIRRFYLDAGAHDKVGGVAEGTHLKTAVDQADVCGGDVKMSLDLRDGTLHVRRRQRSRETGEGQHQNKHLQKQMEKDKPSELLQ